MNVFGCGGIRRSQIHQKDSALACRCHIGRKGTVMRDNFMATPPSKAPEMPEYGDKDEYQEPA